MYSSWRGGVNTRRQVGNGRQRHFNCGEDKSSGRSLVLCVDLEFNISHDNKLGNKEIVEVGAVLIFQNILMMLIIGVRGGMLILRLCSTTWVAQG